MENFTVKSNEKEVIKQASELATGKITTGILKKLLQKITRIDFKKEADIDEEGKISNGDKHVIVINYILKCARDNEWGLCRKHNQIHLYNGQYWQPLDENELKTFLSEAAIRMGIDPVKASHFSFKDNLLKQFISSAHLSASMHSKDTILVNLRNGTFEISPTERGLRAFNPNDFNTYQLPFDYNPEATAPLFQLYLDKVLPDKASQQVLSEFLGYVFVKNSTLKLEKALLLYGSGANGKSVFYEVARQLFGEHNTSEYSLQSLTDSKGYHRVKIANKLVNYASEINGKLESSFFKQLVSGESIEARSPGCEPFIMSDYAKLIFNCNELPADVEHTEAYFRRFLIIVFGVTIPEHEQDKQLAKKITDSELSGIFNWVLDGLQRLLLQKQFTDCDAVKQARVQYEKESDSVALFLEEKGYIPSSSEKILLHMLYVEYRTFCADDGNKPVKKSNFKKRLLKAKITIEKSNRGLVVYVSSTMIDDVW